MEIDKIYNIDCLEGMKHIPDGSIDAIICDLPYGTTANAWDSVIPMEPLWEQYLRVSKPDANIVLFAQGMFTASLMFAQKDLWSYNLVWKKGERTTGFVNANRKPLGNHEDIVVFRRSGSAVYNPQMEKGEPYDKSKFSGKYNNDKCYCKGEFDHQFKPNDGTRYPKSVLDFTQNWQRQMQLHPTQKPVDLLRYLIRTYRNEGETILDNWMGSGTTAVACIKEKRHFIGFELNKQYYDKACQRIDAEQRQLTLF